MNDERVIRDRKNTINWIFWNELEILLTGFYRIFKNRHAL